MSDSMAQLAVFGVDVDRARLGEVEVFRREFHGCLTARADALIEQTDAALCTEGPVTTLVGLSLAPEHRCGHGSVYDGLNQGRLGGDRFGKVVVGLPIPALRRWADRGGRPRQQRVVPGRAGQP